MGRDGTNKSGIPRPNFVQEHSTLTLSAFYSTCVEMSTLLAEDDEFVAEKVPGEGRGDGDERSDISP